MSARSKTEEALVGLIKSEYSGEVYAGTRGDIKEFPCVVVSCEGGEEMPLNSGNTSVDVTVSVQDQIDEQGEPNSTSRFNGAVSRVADALRFEDLPSQLDAQATGFSCLGVLSRAGSETVFDEQEAMVAEVFALNLLIAEKDI